MLLFFKMPPQNQAVIAILIGKPNNWTYICKKGKP